jgi:hypothetical protein
MQTCSPCSDPRERFRGDDQKRMLPRLTSRAGSIAEYKIEIRGVQLLLIHESKGLRLARHRGTGAVQNLPTPQVVEPQRDENSVGLQRYRNGSSSNISPSFMASLVAGSGPPSLCKNALFRASSMNDPPADHSLRRRSPCPPTKSLQSSSRLPLPRLQDRIGVIADQLACAGPWSCRPARSVPHWTGWPDSGSSKPLRDAWFNAPEKSGIGRRRVPTTGAEAITLNVASKEISLNVHARPRRHRPAPLEHIMCQEEGTDGAEWILDDAAARGGRRRRALRSAEKQRRTGATPLRIDWKQQRTCVALLPLFLRLLEISQIRG